jgi:hypothetical protein
LGGTRLSWRSGGFLGLFLIFFGGRRGFYRTDDDVVGFAFEAHVAFDLADTSEVLCETLQKLGAEIDVSDLAAAKLDESLDAISLFEKTDGVVFLKFVVVIVGVWPELELLDLDHVLLFPRVVLLFLVLVLPLAVIHGFRDGRLSSGRDEDEIEAEFLGALNGFVRGHDGDGAVGENSTNLAGSDRFVYVFTDAGPGKAREVSRWIHSLSVTPILADLVQVARAT